MDLYADNDLDMEEKRNSQLLDEEYHDDVHDGEDHVDWDDDD